MLSAIEAEKLAEFLRREDVRDEVGMTIGRGMGLLSPETQATCRHLYNVDLVLGVLANLVVRRADSGSPQ